MADVALRNVVKKYDDVVAVSSINLDIPNQRIHRAGRSLRLRQVDDAAHDRGPGGDHRRRNLDRRAGGQRPAAEGPRHRHGVPELRALSAHDRAREHGVRPEAAQVPQGRDRGARATTPPTFSRSPSCWRAARAALRRPAPARRHGPRHRAQAPRSSCSTSRCPTSTPSCACRCAPRSARCTSRPAATTIYVTHDQVEAMTLADRDRWS